MIQIRVIFEIPTGQRAHFIASLREVVQKSRGEPGCLYYRFTADLDSVDCFHLTEEWASEAALQAHLQTPHFAAFLAELGKIGVQRTTAARSGDFQLYQLPRPGRSQ